ncbi:MAG: aldehyde dehydrogenase family protein [Sarcina sp.]
MGDKIESIEHLVSKIIKETLSTNNVLLNKETKRNTTILKEEIIFSSLESAIDAAKTAYKELSELKIKDREIIINNIRRKCLDYAQKLSAMAVEETGMGRVEDKITKHVLVANKTPGTEDIQTVAWSGDNGITLVEQGSIGVIASITPSTNPTSTIICNAIGMIAAGNTVIFAPHPSAKECSNFAVKLINEASTEMGGPKNIAVSFSNPTIDLTKQLINHSDIQFISATGGPGVVKEACSAGKRALGAGAGNPPVLVDETANIKQAAKDIILGATFDNNLPCIAEKEVIAVSEIYEELIVQMQEHGAYLLNDNSKVKELENLVLEKRGNSYYLNRDFVGKDAKEILDKLEIYVDDSVRCIIFRADENNPLVFEELMMPILGIVKAENFEVAMDLAIKLEHGNRHSAHIHSKNIDRLSRFAKAIDTAIFVKNAPSYTALGVNAEGYPTFTIASKTGEGLTSARTFTKSKRCVLKYGF